MTLILSGTDGLSDVDGTAATPAIRGTDTNTGIFFPAADTIAFSEGGVEAMRIDSSGNLGIGTSSPSNRFVVSNSGAAGVEINPSTGNIFTFNRSTLAYTDTTLTANNIIFQSGGATERARITSGGDLLVGTTSGGAQVNITATSAKNVMNWRNFDDVGRGIACLNSSGGTAGAITWNASATQFATSSDYRLKESIAPMTGALTKVAALKPVTYRWKIDGADGEGFIAHELADVCPQAVTGEKDAINEDGSIKPQGIDTSFLVATLTAAIQEQQAIIQSLTARIEALEGK